MDPKLYRKGAVKVLNKDSQKRCPDRLTRLVRSVASLQKNEKRKKEKLISQIQRLTYGDLKMDDLEATILTALYNACLLIWDWNKSLIVLVHKDFREDSENILKCVRVLREWK